MIMFELKRTEKTLCI